MKKNKNKKIKVRAYNNGSVNATPDWINTAVGSVSLAGSGLAGMTNEGSTANDIGNVMSSTGSMAGAGAAIGGPWGAAIGGAIGLGSGLFGVFTRKKQLEAKRRRENYTKSTELGMNQSAVDAEEYWNNNDPVYSFENGGVLPDLAYVDNNEILRDDNGNITKVPNNIPGTDNHLIDSSSLDSVLSDNIKRPGTKNTFAKEGEKLVKMMKPSKGKDKFAENTNRLNKMNANKAYEELLVEQEQVKAKKGIKPKTKSLIPAYKDGKTQSFFNTPIVDLIEENQKTRKLSPLYEKLGQDFVKAYKNENGIPTKTTEEDKEAAMALAALYFNNMGIADFKQLYSTAEPTVANSNKNYVMLNTSIPATTAVPSAKETTVISPQNTPTNNSAKNSVQSKLDTKDNTNSEIIVPKQFNPFLKPLEAKPLSTKPNYPTTMPKVDTGNISNNKSSGNAKGTSKSSYPIDWVSLTPTIYNTLQGFRSPEIEPLVTNPYNNQIVNSMAKRRMNIDPMLSANARSRAISNYNLANLNANTGANLAARTQAAVNEYAANEALYSAKQNADNAYIADYANTLNNLGQQYSSSKLTNLDLNARNRAAARAFSSKAASQLGEWSQINSKMRNEYNRDMMMWPMLEEFLSQGYTTDRLAQLKRYM